MKRALLIGINYTNTPFELKGCHEDVKNVAQILKTQGYTEFYFLMDISHRVEPTGGYVPGETEPKDDIEWMKEYQHKFLEQPTRIMIISTIGMLSARTKEDDYLYIHFSGHGTFQLGSAEFDGRDECICPLNFLTEGVITDDKLFRILVKKFKGKSLRACFDSCHSGSVLDLPYMYVRPELTPFGTCQILQSLPMLNPPDIILISGCADDGTSGDIQIGEKVGGWMTKAFIASVTEKSTLTSIELLTDLNKQLAFSNQTAQLSYCQPNGYSQPWFL